MRPVSDRWASGITSSHQIAVEVLQGGEPLPITSGSVTLDITAESRGSFTFTVEDPALIPVDHTSRLAPYRDDLVIRRGLIYPDGVSELVSLGTGLRIESTEIPDEVDGVNINVTGLDRSAKVIDASFEAANAGQIPAGTNFVTAIHDLIIPYVYAEDEIQTNFNTIAVDKLTPMVPVEEGDDRWACAQDLASIIKYDLYFDGDGVLTLSLIQNESADPVAYLVEGQDGVEVNPPTLLSASKKWTREGAYSRWIVTGDNPNEDGAPPRAIATDDDPNSPTYYYGTFGRKPDFWSSPDILDNSQAQEAADGRKAKSLGTSQSVDFGALVNPALEPGDVVQITRTHPNPDDPNNPIPVADEHHIIDSITIPLSADESMTGMTRAKRVLQ